MKAKQFLRKLEALGATIITGRGKGGHVLVRINGKQATVPMHGDVDIGRIFIKMIAKQLHIKEDQLQGKRKS